MQARREHGEGEGQRTACVVPAQRKWGPSGDVGHVPGTELSTVQGTPCHPVVPTSQGGWSSTERTINVPEVPRPGSTGRTCTQPTGVGVWAPSSTPLHGEADMAQTGLGSHSGVFPLCLKSMEKFLRVVAGSGLHCEGDSSWDTGSKG